MRRRKCHQKPLTTYGIDRIALSLLYINGVAQVYRPQTHSDSEFIGLEMVGC